MDIFRSKNFNCSMLIIIAVVLASFLALTSTTNLLAASAGADRVIEQGTMERNENTQIQRQGTEDMSAVSWLNAPPVTPTTRVAGTVTSVTGPSPSCSDGTLSPRLDGQCYTVTISCSQIISPFNVEVKVSEATTPAATVGTVFFASGYGGTYYWEDESGVRVNLLGNLRDDGYRVVQTQWINPQDSSWQDSVWFLSAPDERAGIARPACRPAAAAEWVLQNLHTDNDTQPYCAAGYSNGAAQMAYLISQYGMEDRFATVLFESGPNYSRVDHLCIQSQDPAYAPLHEAVKERRLVDSSLGFGPVDTFNPGFCVNSAVTQTGRFQEMSLTYNNWDFVYPRTHLSFVFGEIDATPIRLQGDLFFDRVTAAGTPYVISTTVTSATHAVGYVPSGAAVIYNDLVNECIPAVSPTVSINRAGNDVVLAWMTDTANLAYEVYVGSSPYFTLDASTLTATLPGTAVNFTDANALNTATRRFYTVAGVRGSTVFASSQTGIFKFAIVPGT